MSGRITLKDLVLNNQKQEIEFTKIVNYIRKICKIKIGIQISHAGRKGSSELPWIKSNYPIKNKFSWETVSASSIKRDKHWPTPNKLAIEDIYKIINDFKNSALRAKKIGFDCLEIHMAHGYLLHQFFSPISNKREDEFGGSFENRCKLLLETTKNIRSIWPKEKILGARITGSDHLLNGIEIEDSIKLVKKLKDIGIDYVCVSSGGIIPKTKLSFKPGYQVYLAEQIKKKTGIITRTAGMITTLKQAEHIVKNKKADLIAVGREFIKNPTWLIKEMKKLKIDVIQHQYKRCFE
jgi:NADPH2 dehydrogenase